MELLRKLERYKYISFDVFDTLIDRLIAKPYDLFEYIGLRVRKEGIDYPDFAKNRIKAEQTAIKENKNSDEITLDNIYNCLQNTDDRTRNILKKAEIDAELFFCRRNDYVADVLDKLKEEGKTIIITSDMYLPKDVIGKMLSKCGIRYDYLFVSSEYGVRKSSGKLYKLILSKLNIDKKDFIHIGDNWKSDWIAPKLVGSSSIHYKKHNMKINNHDDLLQRTISKLQLIGPKGKDIYYATGYKYLGPLLAGFCQWINRDCQNKNIKDILFFSRDGFVMQKAYKTLFPNSTSKYVYISRRSVTVPMLTEAQNWKDVVSIINYVKREETWETLLHKMGLDEAKELSKKLTVKYGSVIRRDDLLTSNEMANVFKLIQPLMIENSKKERTEAHKYLNSFFLNKEVAIVDIGWYGTMQHTLKVFYKDMDVNLNGYYIGLLQKKGFDNGGKAKGYIYDYHENTPYNDKLIYGFNGLIESFFSANHGSCKKYYDGKPVLEPWESENWPIISKVQDGALQFCSDIAPILKKYELSIDRETAYKGLQRLMTKPDSEEIKAFGKIVFFDTYYEPIVRISRNGGGICSIRRILSKTSWLQIGRLASLRLSLNYR